MSQNMSSQNMKCTNVQKGGSDNCGRILTPSCRYTFFRVLGNYPPLCIRENWFLSQKTYGMSHTLYYRCTVDATNVFTLYISISVWRLALESCGLMLTSFQKDIRVADGKIKIGLKWFYKHETVHLISRDASKETVKITQVTERGLPLNAENYSIHGRAI